MQTAPDEIKSSGWVTVGQPVAVRARQAPAKTRAAVEDEPEFQTDDEEDGEQDDVVDEEKRAKEALRAQAQRDIGALVATIAAIDEAERCVHEVDTLKLPVVLTHGKVRLRDHQVVGVKPADWKDIPLLSKAPQQVTSLDLGVLGPHLIVAPTSLVSNWAVEAGRFAGRMRCLVLRGSRADRKQLIARLRAHAGRYHIVITSFSMIEDDEVMAALRSAVPVWKALVVDEAHSLKNPLTRRFQRIAGLEAEFRLLLTGTPVQNNVKEMLALLRLIAAELFASASAPSASEHAAFETSNATEADRWAAVVEAFVDELGGQKEAEESSPSASSASASSARASAPRVQAGGATEEKSLICSVKAITKPFILQRTKNEVALELPSKTSYIAPIEMMPMQAQIYAAVRCSLRLLSMRRLPIARAPAAGETAASSAPADGRVAARHAVTRGQFVGGVTPTALLQHGPGLPGALMLMRRAASHPLLLRAAYPDALVLALTRAAYILDGNTINARTDAGSATTRSSSSGPGNTGRHRSTRSLAEDDLGEALAALAATDPPPSVTVTVPVTAIAALAEIRAVASRVGVHLQLEHPGRAGSAVLTAPDIGTESRYRLKYDLHSAAEQPPPPQSLQELVSWAGGDRSLAKQAEQALGMSDFEISEHMCACYPQLDTWRLPESAFLACGKLRSLVQEILDAQKRGSKLLVFSQFNIVLDVIETAFEALSLRWLRLDGSTAATERQELCDRFTTDPSISIFLLTTRAGGLGLNLVAADTVIIYDCDWNPQNDRQAEDRAHRMGQTKPVRVMRMVSRGTIEERMIEVAEGKRRLEQVLLGKKSGDSAAGAPRSAHASSLPPSAPAQDPSTEGAGDSLLDALIRDEINAAADAEPTSSAVHARAANNAAQAEDVDFASKRPRNSGSHDSVMEEHPQATSDAAKAAHQPASAARAPLGSAISAPTVVAPGAPSLSDSAPAVSEAAVDPWESGLLGDGTMWI